MSRSKGVDDIDKEKTCVHCHNNHNEVIVISSSSNKKIKVDRTVKVRKPVG